MRCILCPVGVTEIDKIENRCFIFRAESAEAQREIKKGDTVSG